MPIVTLIDATSYRCAICPDRQIMHQMSYGCADEDSGADQRQASVIGARPKISILSRQAVLLRTPERGCIVAASE
jgi:hypothetical protein